MYRTATTAFDDRIRAARADVALLHHLTQVRARLAADVANAAAAVDQAAARLGAERRDVQRYAGGVWAFLYGIVADRGERLKEEHLEAMQAAARHEELVAAHARLAAELAELDRRGAAIAGAEAELAAALAAKQTALIAEDNPAARELQTLTDEAWRLDAWAIQVREARDAGLRADAVVAQLVEVLQSARSWGVYDLVSNAFWVNWAKAGRMDEARTLAGSAHAALVVFQRELGDLGQPLDGSLAVGDYSGFLDSFFDNVFTDLAVLDRIVAALGHATQVLAHVRARLAQLAAHGTDLGRRHAELAAQRASLLEPI